MPEGNVKRRYVSSLRTQAAAATRLQILTAAKGEFERRGWSGATLAGVATAANVSPKTIQAQFGTKAKLLADAVDYAIRGDVDGQPIVRRTAAGAIAAASDAPSALTLHAAMSTGINSRAAGLAAVVEAGAPSDRAVGELWARMCENMRFGVDWVAGVLMTKPGYRPDLTLTEAQTVFQVAMAWGTYRALATMRGLAAAEIERWLVDYYWRMLLP